MELIAIFKNKIRGIFRLKKKERVGGRRKKTISVLLSDTMYKLMKNNERLAQMFTCRKYGIEDMLEKFSPVNIAREHVQLLTLERAKEIIRNNPALFDRYALMEVFKVLEIEPPPELITAPKPPLTEAEKNAQKLENLAQSLEQIRMLKEITAEIKGDGSQGSGISKIITPEVLISFMSTVTGLIASRQQENGGQPSEPKIMVDTPEGIVEMSTSEYLKYLEEKDMGDQATPQLDTSISSKALPRAPGIDKSERQRKRPVGAEEASVPASLRISEWASWADKDPAGFVTHISAKALDGDVEAKAALDFLRHYSQQKAVAFIEAHTGSSNDPAVESAITTLLAHKEWLKAVIELIQQQNGALGDDPG